MGFFKKDAAVYGWGWDVPVWPSTKKERCEGISQVNRRLKRAMKTWATAWSQCTGGYGYPHYLRAWETVAHATYDVQGKWFTNTSQTRTPT